MDYHLNPVEEEAFEAATKVLLVSQEDLVEVAHTADKHPVVDVELVETAGQFCPREGRNFIKKNQSHIITLQKKVVLARLRDVGALRHVCCCIKQVATVAYRPGLQSELTNTLQWMLSSYKRPAMSLKINFAEKFVEIVCLKLAMPLKIPCVSKYYHLIKVIFAGEQTMLLMFTIF